MAIGWKKPSDTDIVEQLSQVPISRFLPCEKNKLLPYLSSSYFESLLYAINSLMLTSVRNIENK